MPQMGNRRGNEARDVVEPASNAIGVHDNGNGDGDGDGHHRIRFDDWVGSSINSFSFSASHDGSRAYHNSLCHAYGSNAVLQVCHH